MDLSVIIVNYNVKYFLEQCLHAVYRAMQKMNGEVIVVDNNSADSSVQMIKERFPEVHVLTNTTNLGFAKANNQAIKQASGRYLLLLNPDTVVQEDTFSKCLEYMESHADVGCLGVKMIDGKGKYLPESKRALPTPLVAFYKIFGLSALFPRSRKFGRYHLGYLNRDEIHEVDVISGAFMLMRKTALEKTGLLDEDFFMYGEDIDLSYRFKLSGYRNIYFPLTAIIHYKGESTRKSSINYVVVFYRAMMIFARKHFSKKTYRFYSSFIHLAIYIRAGLSISGRFLMGVVNPLLDALFIYAGYSLFLPVWEKHHFGQPGIYPPAYLNVVVPVYIVIWLVSVFFSTGYEKKVKVTELVRGVLTGSLIILIVYALLPETLRYSRALILIGTCWVIFSTISVRYLLSKLYRENFFIEFFKKKKRIIILGESQESKRVYSLIGQTQVTPELVGFVTPDNSSTKTDYIGHIEQIEDIVRINQVDELIFCAADISSQQIIRTMLQFTDSGIEFKIAPPESLSVIGSNSHDTAGDLYVLHFNTLSRLLNRRKKRLFDIIISFTLFILSPVLLFFVKEPTGLFYNIMKVLPGFLSWVGYYQSTGGQHPGLPKIKPGILTPYDLHREKGLKGKTDEEVNQQYAKDYRIIHDLQIIIAGFRHLGRKPVVFSGNDSGIDLNKT
jgi:O-antigen biosynthesis protein